MRTATRKIAKPTPEVEKPARTRHVRAIPKAVEAGDETIPLSNRAMTVRLATHRWMAIKQDKVIAGEVAARKNTEASRHKHSRVLLADKSLKKINKAFSKAERYHHLHTSPWEDGGMRVIANRLYSAYMDGIAALQRDVAVAVEEFVIAYPALVDYERAHNPDFKETDYPSVRDIKRRFSIEVIHGSIQNKDDFRAIGISAEEHARIQQQMEDRAKLQLKGIVVDIYKRVRDAVFHISERLQEYEKREERIAEATEKANRRRGANKGVVEVDTKTGIFHDTLIDNLRELLGVIPDLDLTDDPVLATMRQELANQLCVHDAEDLRKSEPLRQRVKENADKMLTNLDKQIEAIGDFL